MWRKCISARVDDMPDGWLDRAGVAISAGTGVEVSNNHDVMSLEVRFMWLRLASCTICVVSKA